MGNISSQDGASRTCMSLFKSETSGKKSEQHKNLTDTADQSQKNENEFIPYISRNKSDIIQTSLQPCDRCVLLGRMPPTLVEDDVCMCRLCWEEGTEDMRHVIRHRNHRHELCPPDFPESEHVYLSDSSPESVLAWRAEWRHAHDDHSLCIPQYMFGCTAIEVLQLQLLQLHQAGNHMNCPLDYPEYMLKYQQQHQQEADCLDEVTKSVWRAEWRHSHNDHTLCKAEFGYGCDRGKPAPLTFNPTSQTNENENSDSHLHLHSHSQSNRYHSNIENEKHHSFLVQQMNQQIQNAQMFPFHPSSQQSTNHQTLSINTDP